MIHHSLTALDNDGLEPLENSMLGGELRQHVQFPPHGNRLMPDFHVHHCQVMNS